MGEVYYYEMWHSGRDRIYWAITSPLKNIIGLELSKRR